MKESKRHKWTKEERLKIYQKFQGHCAYCGLEIDLKDMQIDHITSLYQNGEDSVENAVCSCRLCNSYKRANSLEKYRNWLLAGVIERLRKLFIFRIAERYGMITVNDWDKKFYFEKLKENKK